MRGVTEATMRSGSGGDTTTRAADVCRGPMSPKCSSLVVTTSSSEPRSRPARTMLHPSVVEAVSATCSCSAPTSAASSDRISSLSARIRSNRDALPRPSETERSSSSTIASRVARLSGPTLPAWRYA